MKNESQRKLLAVLSLVTVLLACSDFFPERVVVKDQGGQSSPPALPEKAVLDANACAYGEVEGDTTKQFAWNLATKSICPRVREFRYNVTQLRSSVRQLCMDGENGRVEKDLDQLFASTMGNFSYLVANPMEPLRANMSKLSNEIYAWPNNNRSAINAELLKANTLGEAYVLRVAPSRKGLSAIEQLIFNKEVKLSPSPGASLRPDELAFNDLPREQRLKARCRVLTQMTDDVGVHAEELYNEWAADQKAYPRQMLGRLDGTARAMILNEISDGLFYLERVKDYKLASPLGLNARCRQDRCPEEVEGGLSGLSLQNMRANFEAFRAGILGEDGPGFLDLVREVGRDDLAQSMADLVAAMDSTLEDVEKAGPVTEQVMAMDKAQCVDQNSPIAICRLYFQYKAFSTLYRTDFTTVLNLQPPRTEADND